MANTTIQATCNMCKTDHYFEATEHQLDRYRSGEHIQDVFPNLSAGERELLISGVCGTCFDKLFSGFEDEEEDDS